VAAHPEPHVVAFLFDLDGTLIDSVYQHVLAWREATQAAGIELPSTHDLPDDQHLDDDDDVQDSGTEEMIRIPQGSLDFNRHKEAFEKEFIIKALKQFKGRINQTALHANIPKKTLLRKIEKYGINAKDFIE